MKFLDQDGLEHFFRNLLASHIVYDNEHSELVAKTVQCALTELDKDLRYNATWEFDATVQSAPPNLPRGYNWRIEMVGPMQGSYDYSRYFYESFELAEADDPLTAIAHWVIDGKAMSFYFLKEGSHIDITDENGEILIDGPPYAFRPINKRETIWFFGSNKGSTKFPETDNARSILDINVWALTVMLGNTFDLTTDHKQIVGAINEVKSQIGTVQVYKAADVEEAKQHSAENPTVFVFVSAEEEEE